MGASTTVLYVLEAGGNLVGTLPSLASGLDAVKAKAAETATAVGGALKSATEGAASGFKSLSNELGNISGGLFRMLAGFTFLALGVNKALKANDDWVQSVYRLQKAVEDVGKTIGREFGPAAAHFLDTFTLGFAYLATLIVESVKPAILGMSALFDAFMQEPSVKAFFDLVSGHPIQAAADFFLSTPDLTKATQLFLESAEGFSKAQKDAIAEAKIVYGRATDNVSDIPIKAIKLSADAEVFRPLWEALIKLTVVIDEAVPKFEKSLPGMQEAIDKLTNQWSNLPELIKQTQYAGTAANINGAVSAAQGGIGGIATAVGGPIGALVGAILNAFDNLPDLIQSLSDQALDIFVGLPGKLGDILGNILPNLIITLIPQLVQAFFLLPTQIVFAFLKAGPALFASLIELGPQIALTFADQFERMLSSLFSPSYWATVIRQAWDGLKGQLGQTFGSLGSILGTNLGPNADVKRFLGIKIPKLDDGGVIARSGLVFAHAGEQYLGRPGSATQRATSGGSGTTINIGALSVGDIRSLAAALRRSRGSYGLGLKIDSLV